jgi:hypothetical protein
MAKYPVEIGDDEGTADALNYLLSGPAGLGQNFAGFSAYTPAYLTGNFRPPFTNAVGASIYVPPIALGTSEMLDGRTWKFTFATPQASPPFVSGNGIRVSGVTDPYYDGGYAPIGVTECTTTYVVAVTNNTYDIVPPSSGGTVTYNRTVPAIDGPSFNSTDCNAKVTVTGGTDRVFVNAQLNNLINYIGSGDLTYTIAINRYNAFVTTDPVNPEYRFSFDATVSQRVYNLTGLSGPGTVPNIETIFSTVIDQPVPAYYWYILEVSYASDTITVTSDEFDLRCLSAQVVKQ